MDVSSLNDSQLQAVEWINDDLHLRFIDAEQGRDRTFMTVIVTHAVDVSVHMSFANLSGKALVWDAKCERSADGYVLEIDFGGAPPGAIRACGSECRVRCEKCD
jgi:hypothetical protein